ncbi:TIGR02444 family protein [Marinimicrobium sp. ARAG 43.8]|uniref:TIGR02444 family protein n=1 Tax=Marinimicrobium sp. ARAG 43.8 TaxID=3418719 RepID=UPI003CF4E483
MKPAFHTHTSLWDFSLARYRQPGVETLCLALQDNHGANVNILLWLDWLEQEGLRLTDTRLRLAQAYIAPWHTEIVEPLRRMRQHIKRHYGTRNASIEASRDAIKVAELKAEQAVQTRLESLAVTWLNASERTLVPPGANLAIYARLLDLPEEQEHELLRQFSVKP